VAKVFGHIPKLKIKPTVLPTRVSVNDADDGTRKDRKMILIIETTNHERTKNGSKITLSIGANIARPIQLTPYATANSSGNAIASAKRRQLQRWTCQNKLFHYRQVVIG
jgi:hypothetical protein